MSDRREWQAWAASSLDYDTREDWYDARPTPAGEIDPALLNPPPPARKHQGYTGFKDL